MKKEYFVLSKKDFEHTTKKRELYDCMREFVSLEKATEVALTKMHEQPILAKAGFTIEDAEKIRDKSNPHIIAAYFRNKYQHYCYDGSSDPVPTYEIIRCGSEKLESTLRKIADEEPDKIYYGIELKLLL